ncbi:hypothetical protein FRC11_001905 [Ceratobasidium sp. 423]|nr:hypothetical protein FRC11_001905 [Ceratobasidium sp. 423]
MSAPISNAVHALRSDPYYLGSEGVVSRVNWTAAPDGQTEILVADPGNSDSPPSELSPVVLTMVGQIRSDRNYLTIDGVFNPDRPMPWQVTHTTKENLISGIASCLLGAAPASLPEANAEWAHYIAHIEDILRNVLPMVNKTGFFTREDGRVDLKFVHKPFEAREPGDVLAKPASATGASSSQDTPTTTQLYSEATISDGVANHMTYDPAHLAALEALDGDREPEFRTINVPAHPRNREAILDLAHTHVFNPICAFVYDNRDSPIPPAQYGTLLPGAVVRISFTLSHRLMRRPANVSHFTATINEIEVLHRPTTVSMTPGKALKQKMFLKRRRNDEPIASSGRDLRKRIRN